MTDLAEPIADDLFMYPDMETVKDVKPRRPRRSKADIEDAINKAAISQIKKKGFSLALVTDIVKRAKIEPIVFYNRYKNLGEFYDEFVKSHDYWLSDIVRGAIDEAGTEESYSNLLEKIFNGLMNDDIMAEILRWEVTEGNSTTERTSRLRELHALELSSNYYNRFPAEGVDLQAISTILVGGLYYMILHRNRSSMCGININNSEGKRRVIQAIRNMASLMFRDRENAMLAGKEVSEKAETYRSNFEKSCRERIEADYRRHVEELIEARRMADRARVTATLREAGIDDAIISRCFAEKAE